jgi:sec-independent protein translocase protein TatA
MFGMGPTEILIVCAVLVLLFGAKKVPELMKGIGDGIKSLRSGVQEGDSIDGDKG